MSEKFDLRFSDIDAFLTLKSQGSVTGAARALGVTASHLSKSVKRLERQLGTALLSKSGRGVVLTAAAQRLLPQLSIAADAVRKVHRGAGHERELSVAAPSFLLGAVLPALARDLRAVRFRGFQWAAASIQAALGLGQFEVALLSVEPKPTPSWKAEVVGELRSSLFASPALARRFGAATTAAALQSVPFVTPVSMHNGQWTPVSDGCPLGLGARVMGHEAPTIALALDVAAETEQLAFGPVIAAQQHLKNNRLVEIPVAGWNVRQPVYLAVDIDRVTSHELHKMKASLTACFGTTSDLPRPSAGKNRSSH